MRTARFAPIVLPVQSPNRITWSAKKSEREGLKKEPRKETEKEKKRIREKYREIKIERKIEIRA